MGAPFGYEQAAAALRAALTFGIHPSLEGIRALAIELGSPHDSYASIQVTGTNGKTSVTRITAALLEVHGLHTGAFVSPDLGHYTERIEIDGRPVPDGSFATAVGAALAAAEAARAHGYADPVTEFELLTASALWLFRDSGCSHAVLEVGMGGRWDATSVVSPVVSVITGVGLDHTEHLGDTREAIAFDKAHIIKPGAVAIIGPGTVGVEDVFAARARATGCPLWAVRADADPSPCSETRTVRVSVASAAAAPGGVSRFAVRGMHAAYDDLEVCAPAYQAANVATAIAAAEAALGQALRPDQLRTAVAGIGFPGRFEILSRDPLLIADGSHNPEAAAVLAEAITEQMGEERPRVLLGVLAEKDARGIVEALAGVAGGWAVTAPDSPRAMGVEALALLVEEATGEIPVRYANVCDALGALAVPGTGPLLVTGSLTMAGEARRHLRVGR